MRLISAKKITATAAIVLGLLISSCQKDDTTVNPTLGKTNQIAFSVKNDGQMATRAVQNAPAKAMSRTTLDVGKEPLFLTMTEARNTDAPIGVARQTRGVDYAQDDDVTSFKVTALLDGGATFFSDLEVSEPEGDVFNTGKFWPNDGNLDFFAYAISKKETDFGNVTFSNSDGYEGGFSYSLPETFLKDGKNADAENQPDIIFAANADEVKQEAAVSLEFHHALAAITFKVGRMPKNVTVNSISLKNVYSSGKCSFVYDEEASQSDEEASQSIVYTWDTSGSATKTYSQSFDQTIKEPNPENPEILGGEQVNEKTFMMIPQTLSADATLAITFTVDDHTYTLEKGLKDIISEWLADHKYTFVISTLDEIGIEVEDQVSGTTKSGLKITNTGFNAGYVRVAIVGYWQNTEKDALLPWNAPADISNPDEDGDYDGVFTLPASWGDYWALGTDGFYYYKTLLEGNSQTAVPLFDTYELTKPAPVVGAQLELSIVVQLIAEEDLESTGWPVTELNQTQTLSVN